MKPNLDPQDTDVLAESAALWVCTLPTADRDTEMEFFEWVRRSPQHVEEFLFAAALMEEIGEHRASALLAAAARTNEAQAAPRGSKLRGFALPIAVAACVLLVSVAIWYPTHRTATAQRSFVTARGDAATETLDDGSTVRLNTDSQVDVRFTKALRRVVLARGEAYFEVQSDRARPFSVEAQGAHVEALGTGFSVRLRNPAQLDVLVSEGHVKLVAPRADGEVPAARTLTAGQIGTLRAGNIEVEALEPHEVGNKLAWMEGRVVFENDTLEAAADELNRYNATQILIGDAAIGAIRISGSFMARDPDDFAAAIERDHGIRAVRSALASTIRLVATGPQR